MALSIKNARAENLAHEVAEFAGETQTQAVIIALEERLQRLKGRRRTPDVYEAIMEIAHQCANLPEQDARSPDQILGYDRVGAFRSAK